MVHFHFGRIRLPDTCESGYNYANANPNAKRQGTVGVFTRIVLSIPSGKILDKNCKSLYWWQTFY